MDDNKNFSRPDPENLPQTPNADNASEAEDDIDDVIKIFHKDNSDIHLHKEQSFSIHASTSGTPTPTKVDFDAVKPVPPRPVSDHTQRAVPNAPDAPTVPNRSGAPTVPNMSGAPTVPNHPNQPNQPPRANTPHASIAANTETPYVKPASSGRQMPSKRLSAGSSARQTAAHAVSLDDFNRGENAARNAKKQKNDGKVKVSFLGSTSFGVAKLIVYIAFVALCSLLIVNTVVNVGNDVFAFVKKDANGNSVAELREDMNVTVTLPEGATTADVAEILKKAGVIKYPSVFEQFAKFRISKRSYLTGKYLTGEVTVNPLMNYDTLINTLSDYERSRSGTVRITFPEGLTVKEILKLFEENGVGRKDDFIDALQNHEYDFKFCKNLTKEKLSEYRFDTNYSYRLEGYLFPDTYDFYLDENPVSAINKLLVNFNKKFEEEFYERCDELGMTVDEIITLASMIEKEGKNAEDYYIISSVFHNRLKNSANFPYLNSDATLQYALTERSGPYGLDTSFDHPYNTYKYKGLPPGPICNPGTEAIYAALYPEKTSYYYFYTKRNGETVYSKTFEEHQNYVNADKATAN